VSTLDSLLSGIFAAVIDPVIDDLPLARASTLVQQVHAELKKRILDGRLGPGAEVADSVIAKQMGVSRAPVRDACTILVQSGLLTKQHNYPYRVRRFSESEISELQLIRWGYESAAARYLVRTRTQPSDVQEPLRKMSEAAQLGDPRLSWLADLDFHRALVRATGLPELVARHSSVIAQISASTQDVPLLVVQTQKHRHQELLDVLEQSQTDGEPLAILRLLDTHLLTARTDISRDESQQIRALQADSPAEYSEIRNLTDTV
jgi:DNA-binding GntR family transcriptional regulator